jgi:8-oxo-dGTP pyrophosphatase MutT (NUDIX family)
MRELEEEIGVTGVDLKVLDRIKYEDATNRVWGNIFGVLYDIDDIKHMKL